MRSEGRKSAAHLAPASGAIAARPASPTAREQEADRQRVSLKTLAAHLGLSQGTVSMALSRDSARTGIAAKTRERVVEAAKLLNYKPNYHARSLSSGRSNAIGIIVPTVSEGYYASLISSIETHLLSADYFFFVTSHRWNPSLLARLPETLIDRGAEGLILINTAFDPALTVPSVRIGGSKRHPRSTNLRLDEQMGTRLALEHLHGLGHRRIAFIRGEPESTATAERWAGISEAAARLGISIEEDRVVSMTLGEKRGAAHYGYVGYRAGQDLLARGNRFTALFAYNDATAIGAMRAFQDAGMSVPEDISVVGYDDIPAAEFERPALTTIRQPLETMGQLASDILLRVLDGRPQRSTLLVQPELRVRGSTAQAR